MDKGIFKLQKHVNKIETSNIQILDKAVRRALKLKKTKLSTVSAKNQEIHEILIHKDTNNFAVTKQKLINTFKEIHEKYPYIFISFDHQSTNDPKLRRLIQTNNNRLLLTINWEDYVQHALNSVNIHIDDVPLPTIGLEEQFKQINIANVNIMQNALNNILSNGKNNIHADVIGYTLDISPDTMKHEITRTHFNNIAENIINNYNGIVEIVTTSASSVIIRFHWNIYLAQLSAREKRNRPVQLEEYPTKTKIRKRKQVVHTPNEFVKDFPSAPSEIPFIPEYPNLQKFADAI